MGTKKSPKSGLCPRISFPLPSPRFAHLLLASFFFSSLLPVSSYFHFFFLPENQFEARCNARYRGEGGGHPEGDLVAVQAVAKKPEIS